MSAATEQMHAPPPHGRVPPQNVDAEKSLLGGILLDPTAFMSVSSICSAPEFYRDAHRKMFEAMLSLSEDGIPIDRVSLVNRLEERGDLGVAGGRDAIAELDKFVPTAANLDYYAKIVREKAQLRRTIEAATAIAQLGYDQHGDVAEFQAEAVRRLQAALSDSEVPARSWGFDWLEDFMGREFPAPRWLYLDLVQAETTCVIVAPPNAGKTLLALDLGAQIVAAAAESQAGLRAAIIENEGSARAFQTRLSRAFAASGGIPGRAVKVLWNTDRDLTDAPALEALAADCKGADLIVLDSLADLSPAIDEHDSAEMKKLASALRRLQRLTGATVVALHHLTKEAWKPGETPSLRHLRGHGALAGKLDTVLALVPGEEEPGRVNFDLYCLKQRDEEKARPRSVSVCMTGAAATVEMREMERKATTGRAEQREAEHAGLESKVLLAVQQESDSGAGVCRRLGLRRADVLQALTDLRQQGLIERLGSKWFPVPVPTVPNGSGELSEPVAPVPVPTVPTPLRGELGTGTDPGTGRQQGEARAPSAAHSVRTGGAA